MDEDQSSRSHNGTSITSESSRNDNPGLWARIKQVFGAGRSDTTLRESLEGVLDRHAEEEGTTAFRADAKKSPARRRSPGTDWPKGQIGPAEL